uniref:tRNA-yW synthesizing protein 1 homolog (S. cerevisiae) n=1 Tax=Oncorhynchus tshawytscha TaxID=74940 RepID=A0A8C8EQT3_ONCTS
VKSCLLGAFWQTPSGLSCGFHLASICQPQCSNKLVCMFLLGVYTDGQPTENAEWFCKCLEEASTDFRYGNAYLKGLRYAVFGLGNSVYGCHYNTVSKNVDKWLWMLSGIRVLSRGDGNCNVANSHNGSVHADFLVWKTKFLSCLQALVAGQKKACSGNCKMGSSCKTRNRKKPQSSEELVESSSDKETAGSEENSPGSVIDVEDLGNILNGIKKAKQSQEDGQIVKLSRLNGMMKAEEKEETRESGCDMTILYIFSSTGYKVIGSHSGGKRCRWTKRKRRCYKPSFYGVESHRCMESTLSLVCANKCDFCWSWVHHTNPVGSEWRWKMDLGRARRRKPKCFSPAVSHTDFSLALSHCDLSLTIPLFSFSPCLPISFLALIPVSYSSLTSSPPSLVPVTKLYVSVGAGTKGSLKKIDRLLFNDFWPRFLDSLKDLGEKQRTVYKLTLVKTWTVDKLKAYSELISPHAKRCTISHC